MFRNRLVVFAIVVASLGANAASGSTDVVLDWNVIALKTTGDRRWNPHAACVSAGARSGLGQRDAAIVLRDGSPSQAGAAASASRQAIRALLRGDRRSGRREALPQWMQVEARGSDGAMGGGATVQCDGPNGTMVG